MAVWLPEHLFLCVCVLCLTTKQHSRQKKIYDPKWQQPLLMQKLEESKPTFPVITLLASRILRDPDLMNLLFQSEGGDKDEALAFKSSVTLRVGKLLDKSWNKIYSNRFDKLILCLYFLCPQLKEPPTDVTLRDQINYLLSETEKFIEQVEDMPSIDSLRLSQLALKFGSVLATPETKVYPSFKHRFLDEGFHVSETDNTYVNDIVTRVCNNVAKISKLPYNPRVHAFLRSLGLLCSDIDLSRLDEEKMMKGLIEYLIQGIKDVVEEITDPKLVSHLGT